MRQIALLLCLLLLLLAGCKDSQPVDQEPARVESKPLSTTVEPAGQGLFNQPQEPLLIELPTAVLPHWRTNSASKPALVLLSFDPLLQPLDSRLQEPARELALNGSADALRRHGSFNTAEPLILPGQTLSAALAAGLISKIYWVFPSKVQPEQLDLPTFRTQLQEQGILNESEAAGINLNDGVYTGNLRGIPFEAVHHKRLKTIDEPAFLHIDMSFFRGLYDNEIKSPLYGLLRDTTDSLRALNWQPLATSLSYSTLEGAIALDVRFLLSNLAELLRKPAMLKEDMPKAWQVRSEALYAGEMYSESKKIELAQQIVQLAPQSAAAHYDRFQALFLSKEIKAALQALDRAVKLDPGYGAAYIQLAQMAAEDNDIASALELLDRAQPLFPENPFIGLQKAHLLAKDKQPEHAKNQIAQLPQNWSIIYHQEIPEVITTLQKRLATPALDKGESDARQ